MHTAELTLAVDANSLVSALLVAPSAPRCVLVLAHGAGAGMRHVFMESVAHELAELGVATLRYQFPYMERGSKRTDPPAICHATVRAAVALANEQLPAMPLFAGGRSFGGRMTSQAQAAHALPRVLGLAFLGFPLHPAGRPETVRAAHLAEVRTPMFFMQGTRDELASRSLMEPLIVQLSDRATVHWIEDADHSFHVPARTGRKDAVVRAEALRALVGWMTSTAASNSSV